MATAWERIDTTCTDNGQAFKTWLTNRQISPDEFNGASLVDRSTLRTQFDLQQQQQQQQRSEAAKDPFKTPKPNSQQEETMSPSLQGALSELKKQQIPLKELPDIADAAGWKDLKLTGLQRSALKNYVKETREQDDKITIPENIDDAITGHNCQQRELFESARLHGDISTLYKYKDRPDFLTFRLGEQNYSDKVTRENIQRIMKTVPVCVAGVSGAGKTRTVLEMLSTQWGIYFSAALFLPGYQQPVKPCSMDLAWIAEDSAGDLPEATYAKTLMRLQCAVVARYLILERMLENRGAKFTKVDWVLMQLYPPTTSGDKIKDVFEALTFELYYYTGHSKIRMVLDKVHRRLKCIVVDEAQVAMKQRTGIYDNDDKSAQHPFLFAVIRGLWSIGKSSSMCPVLCGTGISIMKMSSIAISAVGDLQIRQPDEKYKMQVPISTVLEPTATGIQALVKEVFASNVCERHQLGLWSRTLMGRPRILWGFLSLALTNTTDGVDDVFKQYCEEMTSGDGTGNATTTLYSCVSRALGRRETGETDFSDSIGSAFSEMIVNWLTGTTSAELDEEEKVDWIVDCGVCILERKADNTKLVAKLREPLVVQAYLTYVKKSQPELILKTIMAMLEKATEPSSQGFLFEILFYFALQQHLNGKSLEEAGFVPADGASSGFLCEVCDIPLECIGNSLLRLPEKLDGSHVQLQSQFLDCHRLYLESDRTRPRPRAAATPAKKDTDDLVTVVLTKNYVLVFLIQCKLELKTDYLKAVQTTFPDLLLHHSKRRKLEPNLGTATKGRKNVYDYELLEASKAEHKTLQDLLGRKRWGNRTLQVVQLVVAYPAKVSLLGDTRWIPKLTDPCRDSEKLAGLLGRVPEAGEEKRLLVVVKEDMLQRLLGQRIFPRLQQVKESSNAKEDRNADVTMSQSDLLPYDHGASSTVDCKEDY